MKTDKTKQKNKSKEETEVNAQRVLQIRGHYYQFEIAWAFVFL